MSLKDILTVCLCIEDLDSCMCDIIINQIASGQFFGVDQSLHLILYSSDTTNKLEDLRMEVEDCAFPFLKGISCHTTFHGIERMPDVILVLLSNRSFPDKMTTPTDEEFQKLLSLVLHITHLSELMSSLQLDSTKILITGDLALTAASVMNQKLTNLTAKQLFAIDVHQPQRDQAKMAVTRHCYSKINKIRETVKQWWSGIKTSASMYLGVKYIQPAWRRPCSQGSGYFFSAPVRMVGPGQVITTSDIPIDQDHTEYAQATTDKAFRLVREMNGQFGDNIQEPSNFSFAYL